MLKHMLVPLFAAALLTACGNEEDNATPPAASAPPAVEAPAQPAAPATPAEPAPAAEAPAASTQTAQAGGDAAAGEAVYKKTCFLCHGTGAGGAPMLTDKADWEKRIAQGNDILYKHAIEGYTGDKGMMPPKGGNMALSDDEVKAAVDYMTAQVK